MQEIKEYHITANGYDMSTGKYTIPECYVKAHSYIEAAEMLSQYLANGANAYYIRFPTPAEPELNERQQHILKHTLGLDGAEGIKYFKEHKEPYRNRYAVNPDNNERYSELRQLVALGYMAEAAGVSHNYTWFSLTGKGIDKAISLAGIKL